MNADRQTLTGLHDRLARQAERDGLLDVAYRTVDTPVGELLLAATERGLVRLAFPGQDHGAVLQALADRISPRVLHSPARLDAAATQLDEYFRQRRTRFELPLDLTLSSGFRRHVVEHLPAIPYGRTENYREVAIAVGSPRAVRAVGSACATNPLPIVLPCHRVIRTDGSLGGYAGGIATKTALLRLEAAG